MSMELSFKARYFDRDGEGYFMEKIRDLIILGGARMLQIYKEEVGQRPDGLGGENGAIYTGTGRNSIVIQSQEWDKVVVGTRLDYLTKLSKGRPDPGVNLDDIFKWRRRKNVPRRAKQVAEKIRTRGPIPNPFQERARLRFIREAGGVVRQVID